MQNVDMCRLFGGARLEMVTGKDATVTFADIAGIDQVKAEIIELVQFLRSPQRFLDLGARSPAGVLLVGPPGTGAPPYSLHCNLSRACAVPLASHTPSPPCAPASAASPRLGLPGVQAIRVFAA